MSTDEILVNGQTPRDFAMTMRGKDRMKFARKIILDVLEKHRADGASITEIADATGFQRDTVAKHVEVLVASREAYKAGETSARYHKNGRVLHYHHMGNKMFGKRLYTFYYLNNPDGDFIHIQEKETGRYRTVEDKGGIMISVNELPQFMKELEGFVRDVAKVEAKK